jgi:hypothetical protein
VSETLNGKEIYTTDEVIAHIVSYFNTVLNDTSTYINGVNDRYSLAQSLYEELTNMNVIKTFRDQITDALKEDSSG